MISSIFDAGYALLAILLVWQAFALRRILCGTSLVFRNFNQRNSQRNLIKKQEFDAAVRRNGLDPGAPLPNFTVDSLDRKSRLQTADLMERTAVMLFVRLKKSASESGVAMEQWIGEAAQTLRRRVGSDVNIVYCEPHSAFRGLDSNAIGDCAGILQVADRDGSLARAFGICTFPTVVTIGVKGGIAQCLTFSSPLSPEDGSARVWEVAMLDAAPYKYVRNWTPISRSES